MSILSCNEMYLIDVKLKKRLSDHVSVYNQKYWEHIDGLRAFAVLAVLLFHFKAPGLASGFLGVDIFFTISGFLITRLIVLELRKSGSVDFKRFFSRRIRRLFPALLVTCLLTAGFAYFLLTPERLSAFGNSLTAAIISLSNIQFWLGSGYFDAASHTKPLLHTWSLSVCLLYTSPSPRDLSTSRMPSSA